MWLHESIVEDISLYLPNETFEDYIERIVFPFYGKSKRELESYFNKKFYRTYDLLKSIFGIKSKKISEFEKADILIKTVKIKFNDSIKENMPFRQIQFKKIAHEKWEESTWCQELNSRFLLVFFKADNKGEYRLKKLMFWAIPFADRKILEQVWGDTKKKIVKGDFKHFIKTSDNKVGHIGTKGKNRNDFIEAPDGSMQKKKRFWLNNKYIKNIIP